MSAQPEFQQRLQSIEQLLGTIEAADPNLRASVRELVQLVMDLHGAALERMLELIRGDTASDGLVHKLGRDELVASLLVLYGLHPLDLEERVALALDKARKRLRSHQSEVELLSIQEGAVHLRLHGGGHGCGSTVQALREIVEAAISQGAPDLVSLTIEDPEPKPQVGFVPVEMLQGSVALAAGQKG